MKNKHFKELCALISADKLTEEEIVEAYGKGLRSVFGSDLIALSVFRSRECLFSFGESPFLCRTVAEEGGVVSDGCFHFITVAGDRALVAKEGRLIPFTTVIVGNFATKLRYKPHEEELREAMFLAARLMSSVTAGGENASRVLLEREMMKVAENGSILVFGPAGQKNLSELFYYKERLLGQLSEFCKKKLPSAGLYYLDAGCFAVVSDLEAGTLRGCFTEFYREKLAFFNGKLSTRAAVVPLSLYYSSMAVPYEAILKDIEGLLADCDGISIVNSIKGGVTDEK